MAAAAMHVRGPGLTRHLCIFQIARYSLQQLVRYRCCQGESGERLRERERERERAGPRPRIKSPCSKLPMPSPPAGGWILGGEEGGWLCEPTRQKTTTPSPGDSTLESAS